MTITITTNYMIFAILQPMPNNSILTGTLYHLYEKINMNNNITNPCILPCILLLILSCRYGYVWFNKNSWLSLVKIMIKKEREFLPLLEETDSSVTTTWTVLATQEAGFWITQYLDYLEIFVVGRRISVGGEGDLMFRTIHRKSHSNYKTLQLPPTIPIS